MYNPDEKWYGDLTVGRFQTPDKIVKNGDHMEYAVYGLQEDGTVSIGSTPEPNKYMRLPQGVHSDKVEDAWRTMLLTFFPDGKFWGHDTELEASNAQAD